MGLLDGKTQKSYYEGNDLGNYQFVTLDDVISQFMVAYVGEGKVIPKCNRVDVAFHAQRALAELSFDTFKSFKSQQIDVPPSLTMMLPHDYVNYTKITSVDTDGIKHPLYPTKHTSNPFQIYQEDNGTYFWGHEENMLVNGAFDGPLDGSWNVSIAANSSAWDSTKIVQVETGPNTGVFNPYYYTNYIKDIVDISSESLHFSALWNNKHGVSGGSMAYGAWQLVDVSMTDTVDLSAVGISGDRQLDGSTILCDYGVIRVGLTTTDPGSGWSIVNDNGNTVTVNGYDTQPASPNKPSPNNNPDNFDLGYIEWNDGSSGEKELININVANINEVWVYVQSFSPWTADAITALTSTGGPVGSSVAIEPTSSTNNTHQVNTIDQIQLVIPGDAPDLAHANFWSHGTSSTWQNYKSQTPSEIKNDNYEDDIYWPNEGRRYGLEPSHAQVNGSFFIDQLKGKIHFSSNISGKTVILDYISDSLGTNAEMQVHKFAEDAMYKWITHAVLSASSYGQALVPRLTKEKFAAIRKAKIRLSNIKLEELTQILRGKSKWIKH